MNVSSMLSLILRVLIVQFLLKEEKVVLIQLHDLSSIILLFNLIAIYMYLIKKSLVYIIIV